MKVYLVDIENYDFDSNPVTWENEKFISESEIQTNVFTLEDFEKLFNSNAIDQSNSVIRFI